MSSLRKISMTKWRAFQKELMEHSRWGNLEVLQENVSSGKVRGTIYRRKESVPSKGVLLVHGIFQNRHSFDILAQQLAAYGYFCLSIDMPSHFLNLSKFSLGELSETIIEAVLILKNRYGVKRIGVVAHSMGAVGCLFSNAGYNQQIENYLYSVWVRISENLIECAKASESHNSARLSQLGAQIESDYTSLKEMMMKSLTYGIKNNTGVCCYVLIAPPLSLKNAFPGVTLLKKLDKKWIKLIMENLLHKQIMRQAMKENVTGSRDKNPNPDGLNLGFFRIKEVEDFVEYFVSMKEPTDFLKLVEEIIKFRHKDDKVSFFEYYQKKYLLPIPKLFIYGNKDFLLRPFMPGVRTRLDKFYTSCGNAQIHHAPYSHFLHENHNIHISSVVVKDKKATELIIRFLDDNV